MPTSSPLAGVAVLLPAAQEGVAALRPLQESFCATPAPPASFVLFDATGMWPMASKPIVATRGGTVFVAWFPMRPVTIDLLRT